MDGYHTPIYKFALREDLKDEKQFLPTRAEPTATGWDVRAAMVDRKPMLIKPFEQVKIPLGFRGFCPIGWWYELKPRSSTFAKKNLHALYGTIDETYEGELVFACQYIPHMDYYEGPVSSVTLKATVETYLKHRLQIDFGDAIGQIIPTRRETMVVQETSNLDYDDLCKKRDAIRGVGGFGSTGK